MTAADDVAAALVDNRPMATSPAGKAIQSGSYRDFRIRVRWGIAVALCVFFIATVILLAVFNARDGHRAVVVLDIAIGAVLSVCLLLLFTIDKERSGLGFFVAVATIFAVLPAFAWMQERTFHYWYYLLPVSLMFVAEARWVLRLSALYGAAMLLLSAAFTTTLDLVRLGLSYFVLVGFVATYSFLEQKAASMLRYYSERDPLSNCLNRRTFNEWLERLETRPDGGAGCALLLLDIDYFKVINDRHGHLVGDRAITQVAAVLGSELRPETPLYRYGGEEFAIILDNCSQPAEAEALSERLRRAVAEHAFGDMRLTVSIGMVVWSPGQGRIRDALEAADLALYEAKRSGRNRARLAAWPA